MWRALVWVLAALTASAIELLYFSLPGAFLMQLGFGECFRSSPWHAFWSLSAWLIPIAAPIAVWFAARELRTRPKHPIFGLYLLILFLSGVLATSGFFAMRLLWRLDSPFLQASLFVGYWLALDLCADAAGWRKLPRWMWVSLSFWVVLAGALTMERFLPVVRESDLGEMRVRLLGRVVYRAPTPVCLSRAALARVSWRADELQRRDLRQACVAWPYSLELPQVFRHCVRAPIVSADRAAGEFGAGRREESTVLAGDPAVGSVWFLGQVHHREEDTPQQRWNVVESQLAIYRELVNHPQWPVFSESTCLGELDPVRQTGDRARRLSRAYASKVAGPERWSPAYTRVLFASLGVVGALDDAGDLESYATSRCDDPKLAELEALEGRLELTSPDAPQYESLYAQMNELRMDYREREAIAEIEKHLRLYPGTSLYLVYGEAHQFAEPLWRQAFGGRVPQVTALRWTTPVSAGWDLESMSDHQERLDWIGSSPAFLTGAVTLVRNRNELFALLPKLLPEPLRDRGKQAAFDRLRLALESLPFALTATDHLRVAEWLWRTYRSNSGPFHGYELNPDWARRFAALPSPTQSRLLGEFTEPFLQWMALEKMPRLDLLRYPDLMMPEARLAALDRLDIPAAMTAAEVRDFLEAANLLTVDMGGALARKINERWPLESSQIPAP